MDLQMAMVRMDLKVQMVRIQDLKVTDGPPDGDSQDSGPLGGEQAIKAKPNSSSAASAPLN
jgi:hypothetical protein